MSSNLIRCVVAISVYFASLTVETLVAQEPRLAAKVTAAGDWPGFRGPTGRGLPKTSCRLAGAWTTTSHGRLNSQGQVLRAPSSLATRFT